jgi:hypothetical protein
MLDRIRDVASHQLGEDEYIADFWPRFQHSQGTCWKLERLPHFESPDVPSWVAMNDGDWDLAMKIIEGPMRAEVRGDFASSPNLERRRVRIVDRPLTPYLQWELNVFRIRANEGERIRILESDAVRHLEVEHLLPEVITLGNDVLYEVLYSDAGVYLGARRVDDPAVVEACVAGIAALFARGEEFASYFDREVAPLAPPETARSRSMRTIAGSPTVE